MKIGFICMIILLVIFLIPSPTTASKITIKTTRGIKHIHYDGSIREGDANRLEKAFKENPSIEWVSFDSNGGSKSEGIDMSNLMNKYLMSSYIRSSDKCISACALAFIGGERLAIDGRLAFHSWHYPVYNGSGRVRIDKSDIKNDIYNAQASTSLSIYYLLKNGFSWDLHYDYAILKGKYINFFNNAQLKKYYIGNIKMSNTYDDNLTKEFVRFGN